MVNCTVIMHIHFDPELKNTTKSDRPVGITYYNGRMPNYGSEIKVHSNQWQHALPIIKYGRWPHRDLPVSRFNDVMGVGGGFLSCIIIRCS